MRIENLCRVAQGSMPGARMLGLPAALGGKYEGMDLAEPAIDFVGMARALGVEAARADGFQAVTDLVSQSLAGDRPRLWPGRSRSPP